MAKKVVTFGELMIRLQPYNYERFVQADHLEFTFGGGEANVAVSLANYGLDAAARPRHRPGGGEQPAPLRCGHQQDHPRRRPCGHLLQREGRFPASQRVHL